MKQYLSREESKKLIQLGISPDNASFISCKQNWVPVVINDYVNKENLSLKSDISNASYNKGEQADYQDIFSLGDLLNLLPSNVYKDSLSYNLLIEACDNHWYVLYNNDYIDDYYASYDDKELITCIYTVIQHLIADNIITNN